MAEDFSLTEHQRFVCMELDAGMWRCGACATVFVFHLDPNYCPWCGMKFQFYDYRNGEL